MVFFILKNESNRIKGFLIIFGLEVLQLPFEMIGYNRFNRPSTRHYTMLAENGAKESHEPTPGTAEPVAFAFDTIASLNFLPEDFEMPLLVFEKILKQRNVVLSE